MLRCRQFLSIFNTVYFQLCFTPQRRAIFIFHLASWLRTRRFSEPTFRPSKTTKHLKKQKVSRLSYLFARLHLFSDFLLLRLSPRLNFFLAVLFHLLGLSDVSICPYTTRHPTCTPQVQLASGDNAQKALKPRSSPRSRTLPCNMAVRRPGPYLVRSKGGGGPCVGSPASPYAAHIACRKSWSTTTAAMLKEAREAREARAWDAAGRKSSAHGCLFF